MIKKPAKKIDGQILIQPSNITGVKFSLTQKVKKY